VENMRGLPLTVSAADVIAELTANGVGSEKLGGKLGGTKGIDVFFRVPQDKITGVILVLVVRWSWCLALCAEGALEVVRNGTDGSEVFI
jgi:hypothetical protein